MHYLTEIDRIILNVNVNLNWPEVLMSVWIINNFGSVNTIVYFSFSAASQPNCEPLLDGGTFNQKNLFLIKKYFD